MIMSDLIEIGFVHPDLSMKNWFLMVLLSIFKIYVDFLFLSKIYS